MKNHELDVLKRMCRTFPKGKVKDLQYNMMNAVGLRGYRKKGKDERKELAWEFCKRKYGFSRKVFEGTYALLSGKFNVRSLKKSLGVDNK